METNRSCQLKKASLYLLLNSTLGLAARFRIKNNAKFREKIKQKLIGPFKRFFLVVSWFIVMGERTWTDRNLK